MNEIASDESCGLTEREVPNVFGRLRELGLNADVGICILPINFSFAKDPNELFLPPTATDLKVLFRQAGVTLDKIEPAGMKIPFRDDRDITLVLPAVFFGAAYISDNPHLLAVSLSVIANYVTDYFRGKVGMNHVRCSVLVETTRDGTTTKALNYDGPATEFRTLIQSINKIVK